MTSYDNLLLTEAGKLSKAIIHLEYSYQKVQQLSPENLDEESLETWESFAARFSRVADMFLMKYLKTAILRTDPGFRGSLRDFLNEAEKLNIITSSSDWLAVRELRNIAAHDYTEQNLAALFNKLRTLCPILLTIKEILPR